MKSENKEEAKSKTNVIIGRNVRYARFLSGNETLSEFAEKLTEAIKKNGIDRKVDRRTLSKWEKGDLPVPSDILTVIAALTDRDVSFFFSDKTEKKS